VNRASPPPPDVLALRAAGVVAVLIGAMAYLRLQVFPHEVVPLTYTLPLLVCLWHRNLALHWVMAGAFVLMVLTKWLVVVPDVATARRATFVAMQLGNVLIPAAVLHGVLRLMARLRGAVWRLEETNADLEQANAELAAREEEINQQNEELQSQAEELEQQTEELTAQSADLQALADQLGMREQTLDRLLELSLAPASAEDLLPRLGTALAQLFAPRARGAAVLELDGAQWRVVPLFGLPADPPPLPRRAALADAVVERDRAGFLPDVLARPDIAPRPLQDGCSARSVLAATLRTGAASGAVPAALELFAADPGEWSEQQLRLAQWAAEQVGRAWAASRLRDELDRQRRLLRTVSESSSAALFLLDARGVCTYANPAAQRLTGWPAEDLTARPLHEVLHRRGDGAWATREYSLRRRDGTAFPAMCTAVDVFGAPGRGETVLEVRDVSEQRRVAAEREQLLASERAARGTAERANLAKDEFVATLSHELRTPLNAILGWATILRKNPNDRDVLAKGFEVIERNARHQGQLISDLLDVSRIVAGKLHLERCPVDPLLVVEAAIDAVRPAADAKGVRLERALQPVAGTVDGDQGRLQQVMWNLLTNAVKFTPRGGRVRVATTVAHGNLVVEVRDTGQGFSDDVVPQLFRRHFSAGATERRDQGGLGLGLAIVKHLVELHGGTVGAHSDGPGKGAVFHVTLPLATAGCRDGAVVPDGAAVGANGDAAAAAAAGQLPALDGLAVLVVDDDPDARELLERLLRERGADVTSVASGRDALAAAATGRFHMLVSDIAMPEIDGYTLIRRLRAEAGLGAAELPAIAVTAFARSEDRTRALLAGFQSHISKPVEPTELVATIATVRAMARAPGPSS
jgi:PAS domain S-box-containing protein